MNDALERPPGGGADGDRGVVLSGVPDAWSTLWILLILVLALAALLTVSLGVPDPVRLLATVPFVLLAPGVAVARLARLSPRIAEVGLGLVLSLAIALLVAGTLVGVGQWNPTLAIVILVVVTLVALELDPRIPSRAIVWRELRSAARGAGAAPAVEAPAAAAPVRARRQARPAARPSAPSPPPPVAVVRRGPPRAPADAPARPGDKRQALGEDPLEAPAISRHLRSTIDGVVDDLAARRDAGSR